MPPTHGLPARHARAPSMPTHPAAVGWEVGCLSQNTSLSQMREKARLLRLPSASLPVLTSRGVHTGSRPRRFHPQPRLNDLGLEPKTSVKRLVQGKSGLCIFLVRTFWAQIRVWKGISVLLDPPHNPNFTALPAQTRVFQELGSTTTHLPQ